MERTEEEIRISIFRREIGDILDQVERGTLSDSPPGQNSVLIPTDRQSSKKEEVITRNTETHANTAESGYVGKGWDASEIKGRV